MSAFNIDRRVFLVAGVVTLVGVLLGAVASAWFLFVSAFVGSTCSRPA